MSLRVRLGGLAAAAVVVGAGSLAVGAAPATAATAGTAAAAAPASTQCTAATRVTQTPSALAALQSSLAWQQTQGAGVLVAVVDSGVATSNPHLAGVVSGSTDLVGDGAGENGRADIDGHGTALAGIIAARQISGSGVEGIAPQAKILSVRVFAGTDDQTVKAGYGPDVARLAAGIRYAADQHAQIINVSLSTPTNDDALRAATAYATAHGSLVIAAAGNRDSSDSIGRADDDGPRYPADDPGVIGVAAASDAGVVTSASIHGPQVALSAPGQNVATASALGGDCIYSTDTPATSFSTAYVSGAAALVAAAYPAETPAQWAYRLEASAVRADPDARDDTSGWGLVQPYDAITLVPGAGVRGPASPFRTTSSAAPAPTAQAHEHVTHRPAVTAPATQTALFGGIAAAVALGVLSVLLSLRRQRAERAVARASNAAPTGGGLYGPEPEHSAD